VFERVYEIGPVFRAEPHDTTRHLAEYVSLDAEVGFIEDHHEVMRFAREAVAGMAEATGGVEVPEEIPWIHFADTGVEDVDLAPADERRLGEWARDEHGSDFLFVVGYPMAKRPFYTHPDPERPEYSKGFDLIFRGVEVITGGQRLHRYEDYVAALAARGESLDQYEGYLQAFRYGMPPHGGFAIGLERWVAQLVGARNVRETTLFPRDLHRLQP
jgi:nondiscriminating aspartyl-tRNA synthetase